MIKKNIILVNAPFSPGSNKRGTELAPEVLLSLGLWDKLTTLSNIISVGTEEVSTSYDDTIVDGIRNKDAVIAIGQTLKSVVQENISKDVLVLIIGGDHVISLGTIAGALTLDDNIGVVYIDAHTDINTEVTSPSSNAHGMHMAALMGMCQSNINDLCHCHQLKGNNVFWVGTRSIDEKEMFNIPVRENIYSYDIILQRGLKACLDEITTKITKNHINNLYISLDIDVMNPKIIPATGVPEKDGFNEDDMSIIIDWLREQTNICVIDVVEYNPLLDNEEFFVGKWCVDTIFNLCKSAIE